MSDKPSSLEYLKTTPAIITMVVTVVVVIIWAVAFFIPQGNKISSANAQAATLQQKVNQGNAHVAALKRAAQTEGKLKARLAQLTGYILKTPNQVYNYITDIDATVTASGMNLVSVSPSPASSSASGPGGAAAGPFAPIAVALDVNGPYDNLLKLITDIYKMPQLTLINSVTISGGGPGTNRTTALTCNLSLTTFTMGAAAKTPAG